MEKIIDVSALIDQLKILLWDRSKSREELSELVIGLIEEAGEEIVRCKDCASWCDRKVQKPDGTLRDYTPEEKALPLAMVTADIGINVGSHCTLHGYENESGSWFWAKANDFCSYCERRDSDG